ncbi:MAG TPA: 5-oxoprolinase, partial [Gammaproteobacteria bacterium]|nr:5-oxoprolinase [Gammaproteobacteria bacterium]
GAMHGAPLGRELGVKEVIVPLYPGLFSAWGMLATEPRSDFMQTELRRADDIDIAHVRSIITSLETQGRQYFEDENNTAELRFETRIDLRYLGQEHAVTIIVDPKLATIDNILDEFHIAHEKTYTFRLEDTPVEFVTYRVTVNASVPRPVLKPLENEGRSIEAAERPRRMVNFAEDGQHETRVFERDSLPAGATIEGPLIIEEATSTTLVHPGQRMRVDDYGFLRITE